MELTPRRIEWLRSALAGLEDGHGNSLDTEVGKLCDLALSALTQQPERMEREARIDTLYDALKHGDEAHRSWLRAAITAHFSGESPPPYVALSSPQQSAEREVIERCAKVADEQAEVATRAAEAEHDVYVRTAYNDAARGIRVCAAAIRALSSPQPRPTNSSSDIK